MLGDYISAHAVGRPDWPALVTGTVTLSWKEFDRATRQVASGLLALGSRAGDRVAVLMSNGSAMAQLLFGTMRAGLIVVPLNPLVSDDALARMIEDAGVSTIFVTPEHAGRVEAQCASLHRIVAGGSLPGWTSFDTWRDDHQPLAPPEVDPAAPCNIIYSSGTTGSPKGIVHTHQGRIDWAYDLGLALRYRDGARTLIATGLYSNISWASMLSTVLLGGTLFIHDRFDPAQVLQAIERDRITHFSMVPVQYQRLLDHPDFRSTDTSSMVAMMSCGSALPLPVKLRLLSEFACGVIELYGLTEGLVTTLNPQEAANRTASVGRAIQGTEIRLIDCDDRPVGSGDAGEIVGRSRFVMQGYWNNPEATKAATWIDSDGRPWLRSGDIGRFDDDGYLHIVDRKKDMILSGGQNVYPADIEAVFHQHEAVAECAVIGIPSEVWGETPLALIVLRDGAALDPDDLCEWANVLLGKQQRVHAVELRNDLPRNANGKILKTELRAEFWPVRHRR